VSRVSFFELLPKKSRTRVDVVVSLWAVLEMIKRRAVVAHQEELFGPIQIEAHHEEP
jgi:chromatin segregation and condensation protein Rec8/ScpA/Scc1 (kleisin family)